MINLLTQAAKNKLEDGTSLNPEAVSALEELPGTMLPYKNDFLDEEGDNNLIELFVDAVNKYPSSDAQQIWHVLKKVASDTDTLKTFISNVREKTLPIGKFNQYLDQRTDDSFNQIDANNDEKARYIITDYQKPTMQTIAPKDDSPAENSTEKVKTNDKSFSDFVFGDWSLDEDDVSNNVDNSNTNPDELTDDQLKPATDIMLSRSAPGCTSQQLVDLFKNAMKNPDQRQLYLDNPEEYANSFANTCVQFFTTVNEFPEFKTYWDEHYINEYTTDPLNAMTDALSNFRQIMNNKQESSIPKPDPLANPDKSISDQTKNTPTEIKTITPKTTTVAEPTVTVTSEEPLVDRSEEIGADLGNPNIQEPNVEEPVPPNPRDEYSDVYTEIDNIAISPEQAEEAKSYADAVFSSPDEFARAYAVLTKGPSRERTKCLVGMLATANRHLGYKNTNSKFDADKMQFEKGTATQAKHNGFVRNSLIMPSGFGTKKNAAIWNTPVITEFGFPFLNFSSDAMIGILKSKEGDEIKNDNLKAMFKAASKKYGGIWKAIYAAPLELIKQIATDTGVKCTAKYLKVNGNDLINSDVGENVSVIPIKYYSVDAAYDGAVTIPHDFLTAFYDAIDYSTTSKRMYMKYANGMTEQDFVDEINENSGIPPFYLLVPKTAKFSKCKIRSGSLLGSLLNVLLGRKPCTMVKTILQGKRGALAMESHVADLLYAEI